ncbi:MAG: class I SAM-dependent methyltransferase [Bacilli bacterium]|nr:class I SAM-dependent methyltransferase [Bacilli bacterium]
MDLNKRANEMNDFFNKVVDIDYDERHLKLIEAKEKIIDFLPKNMEKVIDLGAGTGLQLIKLYKEYPNVHTTAIDISDGMLKKLEERHISDNITIVNKSFFDYDFGNDIDAVISSQALHHFESNDKLTLYKKVYECLKKDGVFVNEDYFAENEETEKQLFEDYYNLVRGEGKHYDTPLTIEHETEILKEVGFSSVETCITDNYKIIIAKK